MGRSHIGVAAKDGGSPKEDDAADDLRIPDGYGESIARASFQLVRHDICDPTSRRPKSPAYSSGSNT
jgi:hypothetical protein